MIPAPSPAASPASTSPTAYKTTLLERCAVAEVACDLVVGGPSNAAELADEVCAALAAAHGAAPVPGRALWNLLWLAADLTTSVDLYRAEALLAEVARLFEARFVHTLTADRTLELDAAEMAFDFFFNRQDQPLLLLRLDRCLDTLGRLLRLPNRHCQHAALHGLGHLRQQVSSQAKLHLVQTTIDSYLSRAPLPDERLVAFAHAARRGEIA